jgi:ABC-type sugar transport system substrate-binding protein
MRVRIRKFVAVIGVALFSTVLAACGSSSSSSSASASSASSSTPAASGSTTSAGSGGSGAGPGKTINMAVFLEGRQGISNCQVLWLPGLPTLPLEVARRNGLFSVIDKYKNIHVVATAAGGYLAAPALTATENVLHAHPGLNVIVSSGDQMIAGAARAVRLAGDAGKIKMYGNGCTFEAKQLILQGVQTGCSVYLPRTEGRIVATALIQAVLGINKQTGVYVNPLKYSPIGGLGTKSNISKFSPEFHS